MRLVNNAALVVTDGSLSLQTLSASGALHVMSSGAAASLASSVNPGLEVEPRFLFNVMSVLLGQQISKNVCVQTN